MLSTLNIVPIDAIADRRGPPCGALVRTLRDAHRTLRARLATDGLVLDSAPQGARA